MMIHGRIGATWSGQRRTNELSAYEFIRVRHALGRSPNCCRIPSVFHLCSCLYLTIAASPSSIPRQLAPKGYKCRLVAPEFRELRIRKRSKLRLPYHSRREQRKIRTFFTTETRRARRRLGNRVIAKLGNLKTNLTACVLQLRNYPITKLPNLLRALRASVVKHSASW